MSMTVTKKIHFSTAARGKLKMKEGPRPVRDTPNGAVPRVSRLMALAVKFDHLIQNGVVFDQAELAEIGHVTRARVTQIMNLLLLAPDIQEEILYLPRMKKGKDRVTEREIRPLIRELEWERQREMWRELIQF